MSKRRNDNAQLRREEYEAMEDDDSSQGFGGPARATDDVIAKRRIVVAKGAKRSSASKSNATSSVPAPPTANAFASLSKPAAPSTTTSSNPFAALAPAPAPTTTSANPFAAFKGLVPSAPTSSTTAKTTESANPFAAFKGLAPSAPASSTQSTLSVPSPKPAPVVSKPTASTFAAPSSVSTASGKSLTFSWIESKVANLSSREEALSTCMELLNKEFFAFVQQQVVENPMSLWTKSIQEYIQHVEALEKDLDVLYGKKPTSSANSSKSPTAPFSFGIPSTTPKETTSNDNGSAAKPPASVEKETTKASSVPAFTFGSKSSETKPSIFTFGTATTTSTTATPSSSSDAAKPASSATGFTFGDKPASTTSSSGFSFGDKPASSASSTGFSFGDKPASTTTSSGGFSFGDKPAASSTPSTGFSFGDKPAAASSSSGFSFGNPSTSSSSSGFSFGQPPKAPALGEAATPSSTTSSGIAFGAKASAPAAPAAGGFSFNLPKPAATASAATPAGATGQGGDDDEDDENIGREEATVIIKSDSESNETVLFEEEAVRLRQFKSAEKEWANLGSHAFKLLQNKTTKATRILVRNSIGKIMVNAALYAGMKVQANPKSLVMPLMNDGKLANYLFAMAPARVTDLKKEIDNSIPKE
ncbi:unnamed protein product [Aphanomyces euteiches]